MSTPCTELFDQGDFPLVPSLAGNLIPMNYNIWMGMNPKGKGSSSRLHHDFHDNLYVLLRGKKRFRLFSPADAESMYTVGEIAVVHPNGRICYEGDVTDAEGVDPASRRAMEASLEQERAAVALAEAEEALEALGELADDEVRKEKEEAVRRCEERQEKALDDMVDAEGGGMFDDDEEDDEEDDKEDEDEDKEDDDNDAPDPLPPQPQPTPSNFSQVDLSLPPAELQSRFPSYAEVASSRETSVTLNPGEILFLPAGWFHEVTSLSADAPGGGEEESVTGQDGTGMCGHMAFNFWFHPPSAESFDKPYESDFWVRDWAGRFGDNDS